MTGKKTLSHKQLFYLKHIYLIKILNRNNDIQHMNVPIYSQFQFTTMYLYLFFSPPTLYLLLCDIYLEADSLMPHCALCVNICSSAPISGPFDALIDDGITFNASIKKKQNSGCRKRVEF